MATRKATTVLTPKKTAPVVPVTRRARGKRFRSLGGVVSAPKREVKRT